MANSEIAEALSVKGLTILIISSSQPLLLLELSQAFSTKYLKKAIVGLSCVADLAAFLHIGFTLLHKN